MRALIGLVLGISFLLIGAIFTGANDTVVVFDYLLGEIQWPVSYLLLSAFAAGLVVALVLLLPIYLRLKTETIRMRRRINLQHKELVNLRIVPVSDNL